MNNSRHFVVKIFQRWMTILFSMSFFSRKQAGFKIFLSFMTNTREILLRSWQQRHQLLIVITSYMCSFHSIKVKKVDFSFIWRAMKASRIFFFFFFSISMWVIFYNIWFNFFYWLLSLSRRFHSLGWLITS